MEKLLDERAAAALLNLHPVTVRNQRRHGKLGIPFIRLPGGTVRYKPEDIAAFIDRCRVGGA